MMKILLDKDSFEAPYLAAFDETIAELENAGRTVSGAAARAQNAKRSLDDLRDFASTVGQHIRNGTLSSLPPLRTSLRRVPYCHHLTVGPWMGVFLIDPEEILGIGLVFSKSPHDFVDRIPELIKFHTDFPFNE